MTTWCSLSSGLSAMSPLLSLTCILTTLILVSSTITPLPYGGKRWVLLVAGSKGYTNYRHQADICHAYQIVHANGIPDENIIVMMYDDIANSSENPTNGVIINEPGGEDVYQGVLKDYVGMAINSSVFLAVLGGDKEAVRGIGSERVLESGPHDHVFVYFADHGGPGVLGMPNDEVHASHLISTLQHMSAKNMFAKMVLYIEACESGSLFDSILPDDMNVFVVTAADPRESSFACYYDQKRQAFLADLFSIMWMQDVSQEDMSRTTLHHQFEVVRTRTNTSHVEEYGDLNLGSALLREFIGTPPTYLAPRKHAPHPGTDVVTSRDVNLHVMMKKIEAETNQAKKEYLMFKLHRMKKLRSELELLFKSIVTSVVGGNMAAVSVIQQRATLTDLACYERAVRHFNYKCCKLSQNTHALSQLYLFVNLCELGYTSEETVRAIDVQCDSQNIDLTSGFLTGIN